MAGSGGTGVGVVLSSGGIRGVYAHTGFLEALRDLEVPVAAVAGCSAGAVVGAVLASGTDLNKWCEAIARVEPEQFWRPVPWRRTLLRLMLKRGRGFTGLSDTKGAIGFLRQCLAVSTFEACPIPLRVLAMNLSEARKSILKEGDLARAVMASAATPFFYQPVEIGGALYCDGAVVNLASTEAICCEFGLSTLIVHHVSVSSSGAEGMTRALNRPWTMLRILGRLVFGRRPWYLTGEPISIHHCPCGCGARIIVLEPDLPSLTWPKSNVWTEIQGSARAQADRLLKPHGAMLTGQAGDDASD